MSEIPTTIYTQKQIRALADAMSAVLDDMGADGQSVCRCTKAKARIAYEPFMSMMEDGPEHYLPLEAARRIVQERTMESETTARLECILLKIVEHADSGMAGSSSYALDRLKAIRDVATYGIERVIREDCNAID